MKENNYLFPLANILAASNTKGAGLVIESPKITLLFTYRLSNTRITILTARNHPPPLILEDLSRQKV